MKPLPRRVLIVEDDPNVAALFRRALDNDAEWNVSSRAAQSLADACAALRNDAFHAIVLDLGLPDSAGAVNVRRVREEAPDLPILVVSGQGDESVIFEALQSGAQDYLIKGPLVMSLLSRALHYAVSRKESENAIQRTLRDLRRTLMGTVNVLAGMIELRDPYTAGHERRVSELACRIAAKIGFEEDRVEGLRVAATLHDVGKISIPSEILAKPGRLSDIEYDLIKTHPRVGHDVLRTVEFPWPVAEIVHQHHERMDGSGYPRGLKGEAILQEARIIAVADVIEAMSSHRPYRGALGVEKALDEISARRGEVYDAPSVDACLELFRKEGFMWDED